MASQNMVTVLNESLPQQKTDALAIVLGACLLIIGVSAFTAIILLLQQFHSTRTGEAMPEVRPARRPTRSTATTTQYRPLSDAGRRVRSEHGPSFARHSSGGLSATGPSSSPRATHSPGLSPAISLPTLLAPSASDPPSRFAVSGSSTPLSNDMASITATAPASDTIHHANVPPKAAAAEMNDLTQSRGYDEVAAAAAAAAAGSNTSSGGGTGGGKGLDCLDLGLLSRIDQALASGVMRPQDATRLLKSYGCDLEELLREELGENPAGGGESSSGGVLQEVGRALGPVPIPRASSEVTLSATAAKDASASGDPEVLQGSARGPPPRSLPSSTIRPRSVRDSPAAQSPPLSNRFRPASGGSVAFAADVAGGGAGGGNAGDSGLESMEKVRRSRNTNTSALTSGGSASSAPVIDDELLRKIDLALASGAVRPDQATQLFKSYGCDLEELLREELGPSCAVGGGCRSSSLVSRSTSDTSM